MMRTLLTALALLLATASAIGQSKKSAPAAKPKLAVSIVVDQMRADYLTRFAPLYTGGFKRLVTEGHVFRNAHYTHTPTYTGPGHATVYTGTDPSNHGLIANDWYDPALGRSVYCVEDLEVQPVGSTRESDKRSPKNIRSTTWTDELEWASVGASRVYGFSLKDRGAITAAGHYGDAAFWMDDKAGFVTSSHYASALPEWIQAFNAAHSPASYLKGSWDRLMAASVYESFTGPDERPFEGKLRGASTGSFPYDLAALGAGNPGLIRYTPHGNQILIDVALAAVDAEQLGRGTHTDVLAISFSTPDHLGHLMGPRAQELMDVYLRLDLQLGQLFDALDARLGRGNYYVSLTADHGSCDNPNQAALDGFAVQNWSGKELEAQFGALISEIELDEPGVLHIGNDQIHLKSTDDDDWELVRDAIMKHPAVQMAWTADEVRNSCDVKATQRRNAFDARSGQVFYELKSGHMNYGTDGCTHGSGHAYDTHVPVVFMGPGIPANSARWERVHPRDIAPTWSMLLGIALPSSATGDPLPLH